jgi:hypothetical protein
MSTVRADRLRGGLPGLRTCSGTGLYLMAGGTYVVLQGDPASLASRCSRRMWVPPWLAFVISRP